MSYLFQSTQARNLIIHRLNKVDGYTLREIGPKFGLSAARVGQIIKRIERRIQREPILKMQKIQEEKLHQEMLNNPDIPLDLCELSVRTINCLRNEGIKTLKEVYLKPDFQLLRISNFGRVCLKEVRDECDRHFKTPPETRLVETTVPVDVSVTSDNKPLVTPDTPISQCDFGYDGIATRLKHVLPSDGMHLLRDALIKTDADILRIPNMGRKSLNRFKEFCSKHNLLLGIDSQVTDRHVPVQGYKIDRDIPLSSKGSCHSREKLYPFHELQVGESFAAPIEKRYYTASRTSKIKGKKFTQRKRTEDGVVVIRTWRIA